MINREEREFWQKKSLEIGFIYWREPDDHGVICTKTQAIELLEEILGVEVKLSGKK